MSIELIDVEALPAGAVPDGVACGGLFRVDSLREMVAVLHDWQRQGLVSNACQPWLYSDMGAVLGPGLFAAMAQEARRCVPSTPFRAFLICGDDTGLALGAIRVGLDGLLLGEALQRHTALLSMAHKAGLMTVAQSSMEVR